MGMVQQKGLVPYADAYTFGIDWWEIMSWYPTDGVSFLVEGVVK